MSQMYKLVIGCAQFGPFSSYRIAADLAVKMRLAVWSRAEPGDLAWFRPHRDSIQLDEPPIQEKEEETQVEKALQGKLGSHEKDKQRHKVRVKAEDFDQILTGPVELLPVKDLQFEASVEFIREPVCNHTFPEAQLKFTLARNGNIYPWLVTTCARCHTTMEATIDWGSGKETGQ